jgi:N-acyl homoserine lactone hydrolase
MTIQVNTPQRLYLMQVASQPIQPGLNVPFPCYLIQMGDGKNILVDSGFPDNLPSRQDGPEMGKNVVEQLALLGIQPEDIDILISSHFDMDHAGHHAVFTNAEVIVQRAHYELARSGYQRFAPLRDQWDHPALRYRLVDGDTELLPGIELIETSGHVTGHQSVLVRLPQTGPVLLAVDAVASQVSFRSDRNELGPFDEDLENLRASTLKLISLKEREHVELVIFGHDAQQWQHLKKAPEFYA